MTSAACVMLLAASANAETEDGSNDDKRGADPDVALVLSFGTTVGAWALVAGSCGLADCGDGIAQKLAIGAAASTVLTPTIGHWYAGRPVTRGLGVRLAGVAAMTVGAAIWAERWDNTRGNDTSPAGAFLVLGALAFVVGTIDDIATAPAAARSTRRDVDVVPILTREEALLMVGGRF